MKVRRKVRHVIVSLWWACAAAASAQEATGTLVDRVKDAQGLIAPGVTVTATGGQGDQVTVTGDNGTFTLPFLVPGTYTVRAELSGFSPLTQEGIEVRLGQTVDLTLTLTIGEVAETITVHGSAPVINARSTTVGLNLDTDTLSRLPVGRRFSDTLMCPGVSSSGYSY